MNEEDKLTIPLPLYSKYVAKLNDDMMEDEIIRAVKTDIDLYSTAISCIKLSKFEATHQFPCKEAVQQTCNLYLSEKELINMQGKSCVNY